MLYNVYKNISDDDFMSYKPLLQVLKQKILESFEGKLIYHARVDDSDYLNLNFNVITESLFESNLSILVDDLPNQGVTFSMGIIKTLDYNGYRYYKSEDIQKNMSIGYIEKNHIDLIQKALSKFYSWSKDDLLNSEKIKLSW